MNKGDGNPPKELSIETMERIMKFIQVLEKRKSYWKKTEDIKALSSLFYKKYYIIL